MKSQKLKSLLLEYLPIAPLLITAGIFLFATLSTTNTTSLKLCSNGQCSNQSASLVNGCGSGGGFVETSINFGCDGNSCSKTLSGNGYCGQDHNGITDLLFAIIRFLSDGVGLVIIVSMIIGGIQYITSRGEPSGTQKAVQRLTSTVIALLVYIFAYAIINYVVPNGFLHQ